MTKLANELFAYAIEPKFDDRMYDMLKYKDVSKAVRDDANKYKNLSDRLDYVQFQKDIYARRNDARSDLNIANMEQEQEDITKTISLLLDKYDYKPLDKTTRAETLPRHESDYDLRREFRADDIGEMSEHDYDSFVAEIEMLRDDGIRLG